MQAQNSPQDSFKTRDYDQWWSKHVADSVVLINFRRLIVYK
jgi:hypothetical protein